MKYTLAACEIPDKFFSGSKTKAAEEGGGRKETKPSPQVGPLPLALMPFGSSHEVCPDKECAPWAENWAGRSLRTPGTGMSDYVSVS